MVYGPGQEDRTKLVPATALAFLRGEPPRLASGRRPVDWIYVDDAVAGLAALGAAPSVEGERIDLGSGRLVTIREVVEKLGAIAGARVEPLFGALPDRPGERPRAADVAATRRRLGWAPAVELDEGLRRTVDFYRKELEAERALPGC
jgi:nucleoside-diphosphate-sugar epimerase